MSEILVKVVIDAKVAGGGQVHYDPELPRGLFGETASLLVIILAHLWGTEDPLYSLH